MADKTLITVAKGDGIGPEIMDAVLRILDAAKAPLDYEFITIGEKAYKAGVTNGLPPEAVASLKKTGIFLKAPITTPQGGGYKSVNVTLRKMFNQFANVRPVRTFDGFVASKHKAVDMVIVRENEEDLYAGIEYRQTRDTCHSVKLMSRTGTELIVRYAFEYARANGRKRVTCLVKDNIMKITDGMFHQVFDLIGAEYPEIERNTMIVDIGMARVAARPETFDVVVTENLYGDIVSDIASEVSGSVGVAGSMNVGNGCAMFEAVHGSAPDITGQGIANPSGLLNGAILMLQHIGADDVAAKIGNAWLATIEQGHHTVDIAVKGSAILSTSAFADKVIENLGMSAKGLGSFKAGSGTKVKMPKVEETTKSKRLKALVGVDVFLDSTERNGAVLGPRVEACSPVGMRFVSLSSRGMEMFPALSPGLAATDLWMARFAFAGEATSAGVRELLAALDAAGFAWVKVENLYTFDDVPGFGGRV
ncbi:MAG: isocitrate dehydrogenase [Alphaproteobacteria bacterium CG_4_10_14_0_8_um_filter_53_9]|nr:MAG: isocitrate dehydrogenase [Alphaproteobacteria bacterium CG_4_10_14_0_8_um_filter_53_9]